MVEVEEEEREEEKEYLHLLEGVLVCVEWRAAVDHLVQDATK